MELMITTIPLPLSKKTNNIRDLYVLFMIIYIITISICGSNGQLTDSKTQNDTTPCANKLKCHDCIQEPTCTWCSQPDFDDEMRCFESEKKTICDEKFKFSPKNSYEILKAINLSSTIGDGSNNSKRSKRGAPKKNSNAPLKKGKPETHIMHLGKKSSKPNPTKDKSKHDGSDIVQLYPQKIKLNLRPNVKETIKFSYRQVEDYPVDLYYLMDLSTSMDDDKQTVSKAGKDIASNMRKVTKNFRLGFGSFVDKVEMPFAVMQPDQLRQNCKTCAKYCFRNHMALSEDTDKFTDEVMKASISGSMDTPEGGFDGLMQAIVCNKSIGWREKARRILLYSTDASFHIAGDGELGGIIKPNDGLCHLADNGTYIAAEKLDYPSLSQINNAVRQNSINIMFALSMDSDRPSAAFKKNKKLYESVAKKIQGSSFGVLNKNSSDVDKFIRAQYDKIRESITMIDNASDYFNLVYRSKCLNEKKLRETNKCDGLKVTNTIHFETEIVLKECPKNPADWKQTFLIHQAFVTNEFLTVDVEMLCDCPCEHPGNSLYKRNSSICLFAGTHTCGLCECDDQKNGEDLKLHCKADSSNPNVCSGRGECICGKCKCDTPPEKDMRIYGDTCQCDNQSCARSNGTLCGGLDHGTCNCNVCNCTEDWSGDACECSTKIDKCVAYGGTEPCTGSKNGNCVCNSCECNDGFSGQYCEKCMTCPGRCKELTNCILCRAYEDYESISKENCNTSCTYFDLDFIDLNYLESEIQEYTCTRENSKKCIFEFAYRYNTNGRIIVSTQREKPKCPAKIISTSAIVYGIILAIVLIGLALLLIWKILTTIKDRTEFLKFQKDQAQAKWRTEGNPLYKPSTSTIINPMYHGKQD